MRILSLSGGGVQGLYTAGILARLPVMPVDMVAGTSIGAALAAAVATGQDMKEIEERFARSAPDVFPSIGVKSPEMERAFAAARGAVRARYREEPWSDLLKDFFGDKRMDEVLIPLVIPAIGFTNGTLKTFTSWDKRPLKIRDVVLASSAAPTFFPIQELDGEWLVDGGQAANAPDMVAITQAMTVLATPVEKISMVSVGTASARPGLTPTQTRDWGLAYWGAKERLMRLSMAVSQNAHTQMAAQLLGDRFVRIDAAPPASQSRHLALDGATPRAIEVLRQLAKDQEIRLPQAW